MLLDGALVLRRSETFLLRAEAACVASLSAPEQIRDLGCSSAAMLARERLGIAERTRQERLLLHRTLAAWPELEQAFLEGNVSACQVLTLAPLRAEVEEHRTRWLAEASALSVRDLKYRVRAWRRESGAGHDDHSEDASDERLFEITAPVGFAGVWSEMAELARKVLGYQAPRAQCLGAILEEAGYRGQGSAALRRERGLGAPRPMRRLPAVTLPASPEVVKSAERLLREIERTLGTLRHLVTTRQPAEARDALALYEDLQRRHRPLRILLARILLALRELRAVERLGYPHLRDLAEHRLGLCERTARHLIREAFLLDDEPLLSRAYACGALGGLALSLIHRVALGESRGAWLQRARSVTYRQLEREVGLLEHLRLADRRLAVRFSGPFPMPELEEALAGRLGGRGTGGRGECGDAGERPEGGDDGGPHECGSTCQPLDRSELDGELARRGIGPIGSSATNDPARDPDLMRRLEVLLGWLLAETWEVAPRQTFALAPREIRLRWLLPADLHADLRKAVDGTREKRQAWLPAWVALVQIFDDVSSLWSAHDPERRPLWRRILERDEYRCQAPGCTRRSHLVVHHIRFRSRGGCNRPWNLIVLCHVCHEHLLHTGRIRLRGRAPGHLVWEIGCRRRAEPLLRLRGEAILRRAFR